MYDPKTGSKLGSLGPKWGHNWVIGPKRCQSCQIHQNCVFSVVIIGLYDPKTGSKLELSTPKWDHNRALTTILGRCSVIKAT
jgi:hypothetical protein